MIRILIDDEELSKEVIAALLAMPSQLRHLHNQQGALLEQGEKIMSEISDLNDKLDAQGAALTTFNTTLEGAVTAITTELQQLAAQAQSATDLATLKTQVASAASRVQSGTDAIGTASATLQTEIEALASDDPAPAPVPAP